MEIQALYNFCSEHSGPLNDKKEIEEYILKSFGEKILENLKNFLINFFLNFQNILSLLKNVMHLRMLYLKKYLDLIQKMNCTMK